MMYAFLATAAFKFRSMAGCMCVHDVKLDWGFYNMLASNSSHRLLIFSLERVSF